MARYTDLDQLARAAMQVAEDVRELGPLEVYRRLALRCARDPEPMAQILMCLAVWLDFESPTSTFEERAVAIVEARVQAAGSRSAS